MKLAYRLCLLGLWCLIALATSATTESIMSTSEAITEDPIEATTTEDYQPEFTVVEQYEYPTVCYVEKSKVSELLVAMNKTVVHLNSADKFLQCHENWQVVQMSPETKMEVCSETRIARIQEELDEVAGRLNQLAFRLEEPSAEEVGSLDLRKFRLIDSLNALRVYYGPSPCDGSIVVYPTRPLIEYVEYSMNQVLALFQIPRPTRPPQPATTVTPRNEPKLSIDNLLDPEKTLLELIELGRLNPAVMSKALPRIVSQRYNGRSATFGNLLKFIEKLDTTEMKIISVSALYNEMHRYNQIPSVKKLMKVAKIVQHLDESAPKNLLDAAASAKLSDLVHDPDLKPLIFRIDRQMSFQDLYKKACLNSTAMSLALPEIISQRYNETESLFDALTTFIDGLPTNENKIFGYAAIYEEIQLQNRSTDSVILTKIANAVHRLNKSVPKNLLSATETAKLADLANDSRLMMHILKSDPQASIAELTELAQMYPSAMSIALPDIVSQRFNASVPFDSILNFVENLPMTKSQISGFVAVYTEMNRNNSDSNQMLKLARAMINKGINDTILSSVPLTLETRTNLIDLLHNPLNQLGEKGMCHITNVAYKTQLTLAGPAYPVSAYIHSDSSKTVFAIYSENSGGRRIFRIHYLEPGNFPLRASDTNAQSEYKYNLKPSERYVYRDHPPYAELDWKIVPVAGQTNRYRILTAESDDFMFAHKSAFGYNSLRRVLLGRKGFQEYDHITDADLWMLDCKPGTFTIPSI